MPLNYTCNFKSPLKFWPRSVFFPDFLPDFSPDFFLDFLWKAADPNVVIAVDLVNIVD